MRRICAVESLRSNSSPAISVADIDCPATSSTRPEWAVFSSR